MSLRRLSRVIPFAGQYTTPGAFCHEIEIMNVPARSNDGGYAAATLFSKSWAAIRALQGRELDKAQQITQEAQYMITVPYLEGLSEAMTIVHTNTGSEYQILAVLDPDGMRVEQRCICALRDQAAA